MYDKVEKIRKEKSIFIEKHLKNLNTELNDEGVKIKKIFDKVMYKFQKVKDDILVSINNLMDTIQKLIGMEFVVNKNIYNLYENIYIIDHNYNGTKLDEPITIYEKKSNIKFIENHPHFKHDVIVYTMFKKTKYELFYDMYTKNLIGYRELNKKIILVEKSNSKLKINYSIQNMFIMFGFARENMAITDYYPDFYGMNEEQYKDALKNPDVFTMNNFINKIIDKRLNNIKSLGRELQKFMNRIKYDYKVEIIVTKKDSGETIIDEAQNNPLDIIYDKYLKKFKEIKLNDKNHEFLKYMNSINMYLAFDKNKQKIPFNNHVNYKYVLKHDFTCNLTLNYIIDEINRLVDYNANKVIKKNIINFILEIFINLFNSFNFDVSKFDKDISIFNQILYTSSMYVDRQDADLPSDVIDFYGKKSDLYEGEELTEDEEVRIKEDTLDDEAEAEGYDMEDSYEFEDDIDDKDDENEDREDV